MINRLIWISQIESLWNKRSIVWLSGVRRIGKTVLSKQLSDIQSFNCDLPSVQNQLSNPEFFFSRYPSPTRLVLDEIHRLRDPSMVLKIASDEYPHLKILATGSSTLEATSKFRDSLAGRKHSLILPPVLWSECVSFDIFDLDRRLLNG
jgi:predicted AAA+ superfamily ATPase